MGDASQCLSGEPTFAAIPKPPNQVESRLFANKLSPDAGLGAAGWEATHKLNMKHNGWSKFMYK